MAPLRPHPPGIPVPQPTSVSAPFWQACAEGRLIFQRCGTCQAAVFNPAPICRNCRRTTLSWEQSRGVGAVYSWTTVWRPQTPAFEVPYAPAIVALDEGYQMVSNIIGCDTEDLAVGMRVEVEFHPIGEDA